MDKRSVGNWLVVAGLAPYILSRATQKWWLDNLMVLQYGTGEYLGAKVGDFRNFAHDIKGTVYVVDEHRFLIKGFGYDGTAPDAFFWVGTGGTPTPQGTIVPYPIREDGDRSKPKKLERADGLDLVIKLPDGMTVKDIDYLSVYCESYTVNFGHVTIPKSLDPPKETVVDGFATRRNSVKSASATVVDDATIVVPRFSYDGRASEAHFIAGKGDTPSISGDYVIIPDEQGRKTPLRQYQSEDITLQIPEGHSIRDFNWLAVYSKASDEDLGHITLPLTLNVPPSLKNMKACDGQRGVCPDTRLQGENDAEYLSGDLQDGVMVFTYRRPLAAGDGRWDMRIPAGTTTASSVIAAIGSLNDQKEAMYHSSSRTGRRPSWGIAWWINGQLIPEIFVERGKTYHFTVEGGDDEENPARSHPFYITSSPSGGYGQKSKPEQDEEKVYAGVRLGSSGLIEPTGRGRLCEYVPRTPGKSADEYTTFEDYKSDMKLDCAPTGRAGQLTWTVLPDTPDEVYYQCYTHRNMGWKIHVMGASSSETPATGSSQSANNGGASTFFSSSSATVIPVTLLLTLVMLKVTVF
ncbi:unnamed protein product [Notodromas monacha]|uniref:DM13 domain-containing protein n=1 Tax=Notodromas monacha TaxID=399045 RepID=A0A7R9BQJ5_9CRUS|nr:unnamed protein product [Notodromas monacha]CAG0919798.1 unnamed protein product [Notodromas monacha]